MWICWKQQLVKTLGSRISKHSAFAFSTTQKSDTNEGICSIPYGRPKADMKTVVIR